MSDDRILIKKRTIKSKASIVWSAVTDSEILKISMFGCDVITSWEVGSPILFKGNFNDVDITDKGIILDYKEGKMYEYNYWSNFSGLPDEPQNYSIIKYEVEPEDDHSILTISQRNFNTELQYEHSDKNWDIAIDALVKAIEEK